MSITNSCRLLINTNEREQTYQMLNDHFDFSGLFLMNDNFYGLVKRIEDVLRKMIDNQFF